MSTAATSARSDPTTEPRQHQISVTTAVRPCPQVPVGATREVPVDALMAAVTDERTGMLRFDAWCGGAASALSAGGAGAVLMIDIDRFKSYNDGHGHLVGDRVLAAIGWAIRSELRLVDLAGRYGGDEMVVLLARPLDARSLNAVAERLVRRVAQVRVELADGSVLRPTVTVGARLAPSRSHATDLRDLLSEADRALYEAKNAARGAWQVRVGVGIRGAGGGGTDA